MKNQYFLIVLAIVLQYSQSYSQTHIQKISDLLYHSKFIEAERTVKQIFSADSAHEEYYYYMGSINRFLGNYNTARKYFDKVLKMDSLAAYAIADIGIIYAQKGDSIDALTWLNRAIAIDSTNSAFYNARGSVYYLLSNYKKSLEDLSKAIKMKPNDFKYEYNLANTYFALKEYKESIVYLTEASKGEKHRLVYLLRGKAYYYLDNYKDAIKDYNKALRLKMSDNPYEHVTKGEIYYWRSFAWKGLGKDKKYERDGELAKKNGYRE